MMTQRWRELTLAERLLFLGATPFFLIVFLIVAPFYVMWVCCKGIIYGCAVFEHLRTGEPVESTYQDILENAG